MMDALGWCFVKREYREIKSLTLAMNGKIRVELSCGCVSEFPSLKRSHIPHDRRRCGWLDEPCINYSEVCQKNPCEYAKEVIEDNVSGQDIDDYINEGRGD